jgi:vacuolar protein sorting-associated protein 13A/C
LNHKLDKDTPRFDVQLLFDEIGIALDNNQYRDAISLVDMYHVYLRQHQYRKFRPSEEQFADNRPRALLQFAGRAILDSVHERHRKWTWTYFKERRDDRNSYVELFKKKSLNQLVGSVSIGRKLISKRLKGRK